MGTLGWYVNIMVFPWVLGENQRGKFAKRKKKVRAPKFHRAWWRFRQFTLQTSYASAFWRPVSTSLALFPFLPFLPLPPGWHFRPDRRAEEPGNKFVHHHPELSRSMESLRPDRSLLDSKFEGYKLSPDPLTCYQSKLVSSVNDIALRDDVFSLQHIRAFGNFNHLFRDSWRSSALEEYTYFVDSKYEIQEVTLKVDVLSSVSLCTGLAECAAVSLHVPTKIQNPAKSTFKFPSQHTSLQFNVRVCNSTFKFGGKPTVGGWGQDIVIQICSFLGDLFCRPSPTYQRPRFSYEHS